MQCQQPHLTFVYHSVIIHTYICIDFIECKVCCDTIPYPKIHPLSNINKSDQSWYSYVEEINFWDVAWEEIWQLQLRASTSRCVDYEANVPDDMILYRCTSGRRFDVSIESRSDRYRSIAPIGQPPRFVILTDLWNSTAHEQKSTGTIKT